MVLQSSAFMMHHLDLDSDIRMDGLRELLVVHPNDALL
jgi:hypothetical protein